MRGRPARRHDGARGILVATTTGNPAPCCGEHGEEGGPGRSGDGARRAPMGARRRSCATSDAGWRVRVLERLRAGGLANTR